MNLQTISEPKKESQYSRSNVEIPLFSIKKHPYHDELIGEKKEEYIKGLAEDIKVNGLEEPISVKSNEDLTFTILSGDSRVMAVRLLGWQTIASRIVHPTDELCYMVSRVFLKTQKTFAFRKKVYSILFPDLLQGTYPSPDRLEEICSKTYINKTILEADLQRIKTGVNPSDISLDNLRRVWTLKRIRGLRINASDMGGGEYIIHVLGKNRSYEFGPGSYSEAVKDSMKAATSKHFDRDFKPENLKRAKELKEIREKSGLSQFALSQKIGYSQSYVAELENGKWRCSSSLFEKIQSACDESASNEQK